MLCCCLERVVKTLHAFTAQSCTISCNGVLPAVIFHDSSMTAQRPLFWLVFLIGHSTDDSIQFLRSGLNPLRRYVQMVFTALHVQSAAFSFRSSGMPWRGVQHEAYWRGGLYHCYTVPSSRRSHFSGSDTPTVALLTCPFPCRILSDPHTSNCCTQKNSTLGMPPPPGKDANTGYRIHCAFECTV